MNPIFSLHPVDLGDVPDFVQFKIFGRLLDLDVENVQKNWRTRFPFVERRKSGGLWLDVRAADKFLDGAGRPLLSPKILVEKRKRNPGWVPAGERFLAALAGGDSDFIDHLATMVAQKLTQDFPKISNFGGEK